MVFSQGTSLHFSPSLPATCKSSCFGGFGSGGLLTPFQRGHRGGGLCFVPRVLWENFRGAQGFGWVATGAGSLPSQCLPQECPFPDGDGSLIPGCYAPWRLGHFHRSEGCAFPSSHSPTRSEVASVCVEGQGLSVPCPPLQPGSSPMDFHEGHQRTVPSCQGQGYPSEGLPRRLAGTSLLQGVMLQPLSAGPAPVPQLGFLSKRGEIRPQALTAVRVPGHDLRHPAMASLSGPPSHTASAVPPVFLASLGLGNSTGVSVTPGSDGILCASGASGPPAQVQVSAPLQGTLVSGPPPWDLHIPLGEWFQESTSQWSKIEWLSQGVPITLPSPPPPPLEHLYTDASVVGWGAHVGPLTAPGHWPEHMMSCHINLLELEAVFQALKQFHHSLTGRTVLLHTDNTTVACYINKQGGARSRPLSQRTEELLLWCSSQSIRLSAQYVPGRLNILADLLSRPHMVLQSEWTLVHSVLKPIWSAWFTLHIDLFATRFSHCLPLYVSPVLDPAAWAVDALSIPWSNLLSYAFPPIPIIGKVLRKARDERATLILVAPHWPAQAWFPELLHLCHVPPIRLSLGPRSLLQPRSGVPAWKPRGAASSRLASVRDPLSSLGASSSMLPLVEHVHRPGTQGVYSAHWDGWVKWCTDHSVLPHSPSSCDLANFLAFLSCEKGLSASSVKVHRSAVCTTIRQMGSPSFSDDPLLQDLVQGAALAEAKSPRRTPSWDLFLVLSALRLPPYEPLKQSSLKHLTLKTAFMVSLASGRRCSEMHALSGLPSDVAFEPDGSMSLRFLPDFLAKYQLPGSPSPIISIKSLASILAPDDEDRLPCPVRALQAYRKRTESFCSKRRRLLLSWNENYKDDIRPSTISRWLQEVISAAYARPRLELTVFSPRPHEIRVWASSLAFASNVSLSSLMDAAYWRSPGTFIHFYLRDVSRLREDRSRGIASAVVAQQSISAACAPSPSSSSRR